MDTCSRGNRLGNHVVIRKARHGAVERHAGEDARAGDDRTERNVELLGKVGLKTRKKPKSRDE